MIPGKKKIILTLNFIHDMIDLSLNKQESTRLEPTVPNSSNGSRLVLDVRLLQGRQLTHHSIPHKF